MYRCVNRAVTVRIRVRFRPSFVLGWRGRRGGGFEEGWGSEEEGGLLRVAAALAAEFDADGEAVGLYALVADVADVDDAAAGNGHLDADVHEFVRFAARQLHVVDHLLRPDHEVQLQRGAGVRCYRYVFNRQPVAVVAGEQDAVGGVVFVCLVAVPDAAAVILVDAAAAVGAAVAIAVDAVACNGVVVVVVDVDVHVILNFEFAIYFFVVYVVAVTGIVAVNVAAAGYEEGNVLVDAWGLVEGVGRCVARVASPVVRDVECGVGWELVGGEPHRCRQPAAHLDVELRNPTNHTPPQIHHRDKRQHETMAEPGGFFPPSTNYLPSPAPSDYSSTPARSAAGVLPTPRNTPLKPGSKRESAFINYVDAALLDISRKFTKKFPSDEETAAGAAAGDIVGYRDVEPLIVDLERMIGLVWVSGTASLQIAYLLQIASSLLQYLPPFPPRPTPTFRLLNKLDLAFHTLLAAHRLSGTEKVRLNSIVKVSRAMVLRLMEGQDFPDDDPPDRQHDDDDADDSDSSDSDLDLDKETTTTDDDEDDDGMQIDEAGDAARLQREYGRPTQREIDRTERHLEEEKEDDDWEIEVARVYSRVLEDIGGELGGDPIGIVVEE
ncbi:hypothetical protein Dda_0543 [Drechslerella dactyloides]|uniref:Uncharacterized protein n=1 Tax=Drechslerella dactyloides TaxID=74499 RepID=A0AAD6NN39_DREDA|nr:hypothetical protein Dda_0543 [Drechslerella dactyloides]